MEITKLEIGSAITALLAAIFWLWSAVITVPTPTSPDELMGKFAVALRTQSLLSAWAAGFAALSAALVALHLTTRVATPGAALPAIGLGINFIGAVLLGLSSQFGLAVGFGGPIVWKKTWWRAANMLGWCLLALGFLMQLFAIL
jgi:hypothetical protein